MAASTHDLHVRLENLGTPTQKRSLIQISEDGKSVENIQNDSKIVKPKLDLATRREKADIYAKKFANRNINGIVKSRMNHNQSYQSSKSKSPKGNKVAKWKNLTNMYLQSPIDYMNPQPKAHKKRSLKMKRRSKHKTTMPSEVRDNSVSKMQTGKKKR